MAFGHPGEACLAPTNVNSNFNYGIVMQIIQPEGWAAPRGYANGAAASGRVVVTAGQIGWNPTTCEFETDDFAAQAAQALRNVADVVRAAGGRPEHVVRLTWYVTDREAYLQSTRELGAAYREIFGRHFPAMAVVVVAALLEARAQVEIEGTAIIPESPGA